MYWHRSEAGDERPARSGLFVFLAFKDERFSSLFGQRFQDADPRTDALVVGSEFVLLVRRVNAIIAETEADKQRLHAEHLLEVADGADPLRLQPDSRQDRLRQDRNLPVLHFNSLLGRS